MLVMQNMFMDRFLVYFHLVYRQAYLNPYLSTNLLEFNPNNLERTPSDNPYPRQAHHGQWAMV